MDNCTKKKRIEKQEFDFKEYSASYGRHAIHQYPAMLHYKLVEYFIRKFNPKTIYDPYCGSGVVVVEGLKQSITTYGSDINPLALLIADVRSSNFNISRLIKTKKSLIDDFVNIDEDIPYIHNMEYWFKDKVIKDLGKIRAFIKKIEDDKIRKFFLVVFSQVVRNVSNNKNGEFKRFRRKDLHKHDPDVLSEFENVFDKYISCLEPLKYEEFNLFKHDTRENIDLDNIELIITSPPYGDSKTTVAYGQFSSFSLDWIRELNPYGDETLKIDSKMLGGKKQNNLIELPSNTFNEVFEQIRKKDEKRGREVYSFFYDLFKSCENISKVIKSGGHVIFVVGNRRVKDIEIPLDFIVADFFEHLDLELQDIYIRKIINKRMPSKNSPTNKTGKTSNTMLNEYIVILRK